LRTAYFTETENFLVKVFRERKKKGLRADFWSNGTHLINSAIEPTLGAKKD